MFLGFFQTQTHANASKEARRRIHEYEKRQKSAEASAHEVRISRDGSLGSFPFPTTFWFPQSFYAFV
jgi:hypothetical protein